MIDLHCHILPGVDDGAQTIEDSIAMAKLAQQQGIHTIVATPHHQNGKYTNEKQDLLHLISEINIAFKENDLAVSVLPGQEVRLYGELIEDYEAMKIQTINETGKFVLIEFPSNHVPRYAQSLLFEIQVKGLIPIIVHPERNAEIIENPAILHSFIERGALSQVTAASLVGSFGKTIKKFSMQLIAHNLTHLIASDAHNTSNRSFLLKEGYEALEKEFGNELKQIFQENAYSIISGKSVYQFDPKLIRRKKLFGIF